MIMHDRASSPRWHGRDRRRVGVHGRRAPAPRRGPPGPRGRAGHRRHPGRHGRSPTCTRACAAAYPRPRCSRRTTPPPAPGSTSCSSACRTAPARRSCPSWSARSATSSTWPPTSGSHDPACTRSGTARPTPPPSCSPTSPTGCPSCSGTTIVGAAHVAAPGLLPDGRGAGARPAGAGRASSSRRHHRRRRVGRVRRGPAAEAAHHLLRGRRGLHRLRAARPPAHARDRAGHRARQVLFTPHLAPMNRGILATCYARPTGADLHRRRCSTCCATPTPASRSWSWATGRRRPRPPSAPTPPTLTARFDERTGWVVALSAIDNLTKGASGQAVQCANLLLGLPEATGLPDRRGVPVSVHRAPHGLRAPNGDAPCGHQGVGRRPTSASSPPSTARRWRPPACSPRT